jgi:hypothetical protein
MTGDCVVRGWAGEGLGGGVGDVCVGTEWVFLCRGAAQAWSKGEGERGREVYVMR